LLVLVADSALLGIGSHFDGVAVVMMIQKQKPSLADRHQKP
jgi:hypothetical protein